MNFDIYLFAQIMSDLVTCDATNTPKSQVDISLDYKTFDVLIVNLILVVIPKVNKE